MYGTDDNPFGDFILSIAGARAAGLEHLRQAFGRIGRRSRTTRPVRRLGHLVIALLRMR